MSVMSKIEISFGHIETCDCYIEVIRTQDSTSNINSVNAYCENPGEVIGLEFDSSDIVAVARRS
jgi:hypothetical protein